MLNDQSIDDIRNLYYRIKCYKTSEISAEIIQLTDDFLYKMDTEIKQQISIIGIFRIINENIFQFYCKLQAYIYAFAPNNSIYLFNKFKFQFF